MTGNQKVSVIIPVYNGERYIVQAIESVLSQTYENFEVIIVNDGSMDNSYEKIEPFLKQRNIKYIEQKNKGVAAARNTAIKNSSGELIAFLDQDDLWLPEKLEIQVDYLRRHSEVGLVHSNISYINECPDIAETPQNWPTNIHGMCFKDLFVKNCIAVLTVVVNRTCLDFVGPLNESIPRSDDYELWLRVSRRFPIGHVGTALAIYRIHESNTSRSYLGMKLAELIAINSIINQFPDVYRELGNCVVNKRLFELAFEIGSLYMWPLRDYETARKYFIKAIRKRPSHWISYKRLLWCSLTSSQRRALQWYFHRLQPILK